MLIPDAENAVVDICKLRDYCLNLGNQRDEYTQVVRCCSLDG
jgi:hypothetical protein